MLRQRRRVVGNGWCAAVAMLALLVLAACAAAPARATEAETPPAPHAMAQPTQTPDGRPIQPPQPPAPPTHTPTPEPTGGAPIPGGPIGDCFGGVLSQDPLHCYALERAQAKGIIDVDAIYDSAGLLYVTIRQPKVAREVYRFLRDSSFEFFDTWPKLVPYDKYARWVDACVNYWGGSFRNCYLRTTGVTERWTLPKSSQYENILLVGGESGRREIPGWASWVRVWPGPPPGRPAPPVVAYDVSDVDLKSYPEPNCGDLRSSSCQMWERHPGLGIAGSHGNAEASYYQIKNPPTDDSGLEALKKKLDICHGQVAPCKMTAPDGRTWYLSRGRSNTVIIPVKHDFEELWRWSVILNRFAVSSGNTIGITRATVSWNSGAHRPNNPDVVYLNGVKPATDREPEHMREMVVLRARDIHVAAAALPVLLPQLGIPVDAVGIVRRSDQGDR